MNGSGTDRTYEDAPDHETVWRALERDSRQHYRWTYFWLFFFVILTLILVAAYLLTGDAHTKDATLIGFIGAGLGVFGILISAVTGPLGKKLPELAFLKFTDMPLRDFVSKYEMHHMVSNEKIRAHAEELLILRAEQEREARLLKNRLLSIVVVTVLSLTLWLAFGEPLFAAVNEVAGLLITQTQYYTMPTAAMKLVQRSTTHAFASPTADSPVE